MYRLVGAIGVVVEDELDPGPGTGIEVDHVTLTLIGWGYVMPDLDRGVGYQ
jgi:hypothetical protein